MSGRGRGRGRGRGLSFDVELLGIDKGEKFPQPSQQPPSLFPPLPFKPVPLVVDEGTDYWLRVKQSLRTSFSESSYFIKPSVIKKDIVRYSDRYQSSANSSQQWNIDWKRFPKELHAFQSKLGDKKKSSRKNVVRAITDIDKKLTELEQKESKEGEEEVEEEQEEKEGDENEREGDEEFLDEDDLEEGTDYNMTYFDNGEGYLDEDEDNLDDGPVY